MTTTLQPINSLSPGANLDAYMATISAIPILTITEERELTKDLQLTNNVESARKLVMSHLRFVAYIARSYSGYGLNQGDLIQEGNVGLMKAIKRFDFTVGVRLVSFAVHWIKSEIHEFILRNWRIVKIATTKAQRKLFFNLRNKKKNLSWLSQQEAKNIAEDLGVDASAVFEMEKRLSNFDAAFDGSDNENEDDLYAPAHYLEDNSFNPEITVLQNETSLNNQEQLHLALQSLDDRSRNILQQRWLTDQKSTLHDLADEYDVSAERIRQLEQNAMKKIRAAMEA
jgi:RNA polymerase sigma-32 factor